MIAGAAGTPISRESWEIVISVRDGIGVLLCTEGKDAMVRLPPYEVIAKNPRTPIHNTKGLM
jgi:hypothetical protein